MTITIRPAVTEDVDCIVRVYLESAEYHATLDPERYHAPPRETITTRYREGLEHPSSRAGKSITLVAVHCDEVVGFLDARLDRSGDPMHREMIYCHIAEIAVDKRFQNHGIGGRLLREAEEWGRGRNAKFAFLEYLASNTRAGSFYQGMGYRVGSHAAILRL